MPLDGSRLSVSVTLPDDVMEECMDYIVDHLDMNPYTMTDEECEDAVQAALPLFIHKMKVEVIEDDY